MAEKKRKRKEEFDKDTHFELHGREVPSAKIRRWEERNANKQDENLTGGAGRFQLSTVAKWEIAHVELQKPPKAWSISRLMDPQLRYR